MARILLVEDDASTLRATALFLSDLGHEVEKAVSLQEAREAAAFGGFDLLVLDRNLPDGLGDELLAIGAPSIVLSGYIDEKGSGAHAGLVEYLSKPASPNDLIAAVTRLCRPRTANGRGAPPA